MFTYQRASRPQAWQLTDAVFEKSGKQIPYRKVSLTPTARSVDETTSVGFVIKDSAASPSVKRKRQKKATLGGKQKRAQALETSTQAKPARKAVRSEVGPDSGIEEALRGWRLAEARRHGVPAFRIFSDQALRAIASKRPGTAGELLAIPGIGISTVEKYGSQIYRILLERKR